MDSVAVGEARPGDVLLVTQRPGDPLAELIIQLDGAAGDFSHSGIALGGGGILSSYIWNDPARALGFGGLRHDCFEHFWGEGQSIHLLTLSDDDRERAAAAIAGYPDDGGGFSLPKIVLVAGCLYVLRHVQDPAGQDRVLRSAIAAAEAWAGTADGGFYCAEFVAHVLGWRFTLDELRPEQTRRTLVADSLRRVGLEIAEKVLMAGTSDHQKATMHAFVEDMLDVAPEFFDEGVEATLRSILQSASEAVRRLVAGLRRRWGLLPAEPLPGTTVLPSALVTPRMVMKRHRGQEAPPRVARERTPCAETRGLP